MFSANFDKIPLVEHWQFDFASSFENSNLFELLLNFSLIETELYRFNRENQKRFNSQKREVVPEICIFASLEDNRTQTCFAIVQGTEQ